MRIVCHLGAHSTDEGRILACLEQNRDRLAASGTALPDPASYRPLLRQTQARSEDEIGTDALEGRLLSSICPDALPERLILSNDSFLAAPARVFKRGALYTQAGDKALWLSRLFPNHHTSFFLGLRNPATFIPAVYGRLRETSFKGFLGDVDPRAVRWSHVVRAIAEAAPGRPLIVWCNEDTPLIWSELLGAIAGEPADPPFAGQDDFLSGLMTDAGLKRMHAYLTSHAPADEAQRRRTVSAFLEKFAIPDAVEMELDLPGWTETLVEEITEAYEKDMSDIHRIPGVTFLEA